jgi:hypothetical protein
MNKDLEELVDVLNGPPGWKADLERLIDVSIAQAIYVEHMWARSAAYPYPLEKGFMVISMREWDNHLKELEVKV